MEPLLLIISLGLLLMALMFVMKIFGDKTFENLFGSPGMGISSGLTDLVSVLIAVFLISVIIASRDPLLVFLLLVLLFRKVTYSPKVQTEFDYRTSMYDEGYTGTKMP